MMNLTENIMSDADERPNGNARRKFWMIVSGLFIIATFGAITGFLAQVDAQNDDVTSQTNLVMLGVFVAIIVALGFVIWKLAQLTKHSGERVLPRERLNNRVIWGCGILGGCIGLALAAADMMGTNDGNIFGSDPIPAALAIVLSAAIGVILPAVTFYWHKRVIDEQEEAAYRAGALIAIYAFWFIAPVWWLLWRGGMLPAPDGVALYLMTIFAALIVWFWKKYR